MNKAIVSPPRFQAACAPQAAGQINHHETKQGALYQKLIYCDVRMVSKCLHFPNFLY